MRKASSKSVSFLAHIGSGNNTETNIIDLRSLVMKLEISKFRSWMSQKEVVVTLLMDPVLDLLALRQNKHELGNCLASLGLSGGG